MLVSFTSASFVHRGQLAPRRTIYFLCGLSPRLCHGAALAGVPKLAQAVAPDMIKEVLAFGPGERLPVALVPAPGVRLCACTKYYKTGAKWPEATAKRINVLLNEVGVVMHAGAWGDGGPVQARRVAWSFVRLT